MTNKFKAGDKVVRTEYYYGYHQDFMKKGNIYTVSHYDGLMMFVLEGSGVYNDDAFQLAEEKPKFTSMKFRVNSPEHSEEIQEALFAMGYVWNGEKCPKVFTGSFDFISTDNFGKIRYGSVICCFSECGGEEHVIETVKSYKIVPVEIAKQETITIDGKQYDKEAVLKRLAELEVVG